MRYEGGQYYLKSEEEMQKVFPYAREAMDNTHKIAGRCNVEIVLVNKRYQSLMFRKDMMHFLT